MAFGIITGSVLGGIADLLSGERANRANERNVERQIEFQDMMSRTQYQRAVVDMKAAGLNPMLAYSQGGNASPSGAAAVNQPTNVGQTISNAIQGRIAGAQVKQMEAQAAKTALEAEAVASEIPGIQAESRTRQTNAILAEKSLANQLSLLGFRVTREGALAEIEDARRPYAGKLAESEEIYNRYRAGREWIAADYDDRTLGDRVRSMSAATRREIALALMQEYGVPGARRQAEVDESDYGAIRPYIKDGAWGGGGAASAAMLDRAARLVANRRWKLSKEPQRAGEARLKRPDLELEAPFPY